MTCYPMGLKTHPNFPEHQQVKLGNWARFHVDVSAEYAEQILRRVDLFNNIRAVDPNVSSLAFSDDSGVYLSVPTDRETAPSVCHMSNRRMLVTPKGACWKARSEHLPEVEILTEVVNLDQIRAIVLARVANYPHATPKSGPRRSPKQESVRQRTAFYAEASE